ncbi:MAG TPA: hypothetical protein VF640_05415 [Acidimicrobiales bacterium]
MPVESRRRRPSTLVIASVAVAGILTAVVLFLVVVGAVRGGDVEVRLGDDEFRAGDAASQAESIARDGPLLFADVAGGDRDIVLQHLGDDPGSGWLAFDARPPGASRDCFARWEGATKQFVDTCDGTAYPSDGKGLTRYEVQVDDGEVIVDLRSPVDP